jgi:hypothetical protein
MYVTALNSSVPSEYFQNSTIQQLLDKLMIEEWHSSLMYDSYYSECESTQCTYIVETRNGVICRPTTGQINYVRHSKTKSENRSGSTDCSNIITHEREEQLMQRRFLNSCLFIFCWIKDFATDKIVLSVLISLERFRTTCNAKTISPFISIARMTVSFNSTKELL